MVQSARVVDPVSNARQRLGKLGEDLAARLLQREGYEILTRNYRCEEGEMDIIARQGERLAFVEVRARRGSSYGTPKESITRSKQERLVRVASAYLSAHNLQDIDWGIDAVSVLFTPGGELGSIELVRDAVQGLG